MAAKKRPFLTAKWHHLVMLNYKIDPEVLLPLVPVGTELDQWNGKTYISRVARPLPVVGCQQAHDAHAMWVVYYCHFQ